MKMLVAVLLSVSAAFPAAAADEASGKLSPLELFEQRILPIFRSPEPSSCVQCHLAAVDLKDYILPSQNKTFASLREQGLVDVNRPEESKILRLIRMGEKDLDEGARLIHAKTRAAEYEAFATWIKACCNDSELVALSSAGSKEQARPKRPDAVIRHARKSRVVDSFVRKVWSQRMRCFPCHTPHEIDETNPKHRRPIERVRKLELEHGKELAERLRIFKGTPEATIQYLIESSRSFPPGELPLINLKSPRKSLIVLKPTSKLPKKTNGKREKPSSVEPISHLGGLKMHVDDPSYKAFISWIEDYAKVVGDEYDSVDELPADNWYASKHVVIVRGVPQNWSKRNRVQLFVHEWDEQGGSWRAEPIAFTQNTVTPRGLVVGTLFLLTPLASESANDWDPENATLAPGKYLIKAFVDSKRRLAEDPTLLLGGDDLYGQAEIQADWGKGFRNAEKIPGDLFK